MKVGDVVRGVSCRFGGGEIRGTVVSVKEHTLVVSTGKGNELVKKNGVEKVKQEITSQLINEFLQDRGYKKNTWTIYQKHLELVMKLTGGKISPSSIADTQKFIDEKMPAAKAKQALNALKQYLGWVGYYEVEVAEPVKKQKSKLQLKPSTGMPDISKEERERKTKEMIEKIKNESAVESATEDVQKPINVINEETILDSSTATFVMIGKAFVKICSKEKEVHLTKEHLEATTLDEDQARIIIDEFGGRTVQIETRHILKYH